MHIKHHSNLYILLHWAKNSESFLDVDAKFSKIHLKPLSLYVFDAVKHYCLSNIEF